MNVSSCIFLFVDNARWSASFQREAQPESSQLKLQISIFSEGRKKSCEQKSYLVFRQLISSVVKSSAHMMAELGGGVNGEEFKGGRKGRSGQHGDQVISSCKTQYLLSALISPSEIST